MTAECLRCLYRLGIHAEDISVAGVHWSKRRAVNEQLPPGRPEGSVIGWFGLTGATVGGVVTLVAAVLSPAWGLLHELGLLTSLSLGAVLGCGLGTMIGLVVASDEFGLTLSLSKLVRNRVTINVRLPEESSQIRLIKAIMLEGGGDRVTIEQAKPSLPTITRGNV